MTIIFLKQRVKDYQTWKSAFDKQADARELLGSRGCRIFRDLHEPEEVILFLELDETLVGARQFIQSPDFKKVTGGLNGDGASYVEDAGTVPA